MQIIGDFAVVWLLSPRRDFQPPPTRRLAKALAALPAHCLQVRSCCGLPFATRCMLGCQQRVVADHTPVAPLSASKKSCSFTASAITSMPSVWPRPASMQVRCKIATRRPHQGACADWHVLTQAARCDCGPARLTVLHCRLSVLAARAWPHRLPGNPYLRFEFLCFLSSVVRCYCGTYATCRFIRVLVLVP